MSFSEGSRIWVYGSAAVLCIFLSGCRNAQEYEMENLSNFRGLSGNVSVSKDNLGDTTLVIDVESVPDSLSGLGNNHFLAWAGDDNQTERLGALKRDGTDGELIATTDLNRFRVLITRESSEDVSKPTNVPILQSPNITVN